MRRIAANRGLEFLPDSIQNAALICRNFLRYESSLLGVVSLDSLDVTGVNPSIVARNRIGSPRRPSIRPLFSKVGSMAKAPKKLPTTKAASEDQLMLDNAVGQIEKMFGKGSIMKLNPSENAGGFPGSPQARCRSTSRLVAVDFLAAESLNCSDRNPAVRQHWHCMRSQMLRRKAELRRSWMQNMLWIRSGHDVWV